MFTLRQSRGEATVFDRALATKCARDVAHYELTNDPTFKHYREALQLADAPLARNALTVSRSC